MQIFQGLDGTCHHHRRFLFGACYCLEGERQNSRPGKGELRFSMGVWQRTHLNSNCISGTDSVAVSPMSLQRGGGGGELCVLSE